MRLKKKLATIAFCGCSFLTFTVTFIYAGIHTHKFDRNWLFRIPENVENFLEGKRGTIRIDLKDFAIQKQSFFQNVKTYVCKWKTCGFWRKRGKGS